MEGREWSLVNWKWVTLTPGSTINDVKGRAALNYDSNERKRVRNFNTELIITMGRRQIVQFAARPPGLDPHVAPEDALSGIVKLELARDVIEAQAKCCIHVRDFLDNFSPEGVEERL